MCCEAEQSPGGFTCSYVSRIQKLGDFIYAVRIVGVSIANRCDVGLQSVGPLAHIFEEVSDCPRTGADFDVQVASKRL